MKEYPMIKENGKISNACESCWSREYDHHEHIYRCTKEHCSIRKYHGDDINTEGLLSPCPICGSRDVYLKLVSASAGRLNYVNWKVGCNHCGLSNSFSADKTCNSSVYNKEGIIKYWNTRKSNEV